MHYYQFNIKTYSFATKHLSNMEDLAYRRLIDLYYDGEKPLVNDVKTLAKKIGMRDFQTEIDEVLSEFFLVDGDTFRHEKADKEIAAYHSRLDVARSNGKKGGRPKQTQSKPKPNPSLTQSVNLANPNLTTLKANQEPITNNKEPVTSNQEPITNNKEPVTSNQEPVTNLKHLSSGDDGNKPVINCPHEKIKSEYNRILVERPQVEILSDGRKAKLRSIWNLNKDFQNIQFWTEFFEYVKKSDFLMGRSNSDYKGCDFDFLLQKSKFIKTYEGGYHQ